MADDPAIRSVWVWTVAVRARMIQRMCSASRHDAPGEIALVARVGSILDVLGEAGVPLGVSEIARRTDLPKSTAQRLLGALVQARLVERHRTSYRLGLHLFELGQQVPRQRDLELLARPVLADLRAATRNTVHLAMLEGREMVYLDVLPGPDAPALPTRIGGRYPAHATAVGKAALAFSSDEAVDFVVAGGLPRQSPRTVTAPQQLARELDRVRDRRLAYDLEEGQLGVVCVAAPVFDADGDVVAALSVSGWSGRMNLDRVGAAVRPAAERLSRALQSQRL